MSTAETEEILTGGIKRLHDAKSKEEARLFLESAEPDQQRNLVQELDKNQRTALHVATALERTDVVEYLCSICQPSSELILKKDRCGWTALCFANNKVMAQLLVESLEPDKRKDLLTTVDRSLNTPLHIAAQYDKMDVLKYLCSVTPAVGDLILKKNNCEKTVLHYADSREMAQLLVESVEPDKRGEFISTVDEDQHTALHTAAADGETEVVEYLCSVPLADSEVVLKPDLDGETALHSASSGKVVNTLISALSSELIPNLLSTKDKDGNTVVLCLIKKGKHDSLTTLLEYVEEVDNEEIVLLDLLNQKNNYKQNILHLAALSLATAELFEVFQDFIPDMDIDALMSPDVNNNTPLHYVAAKYDAKVFADFILRLSLPRRQSVAALRNKEQSDCTTILQKDKFSEAFYLQNVLCNKEAETYLSILGGDGYDLTPEIGDQLFHPDEYYEPSESIFKVLKYALNEYSLLDSAYTISHRLFSLALCTQLAPADKSSEGTKPDSICIHIDLDEVDEPKQENVQSILNSMNVKEHHGKPKIAVIRCTQSDEDLNLVVPGPDYLILTVFYTTSAYKRKQVADLNRYRSTDRLINELRYDADVNRVCVNTSLNKKYLRDTAEASHTKVMSSGATSGACSAGEDIRLSSTNLLLVTGTKRGKALIICNQMTSKPGMSQEEIITAKSRQVALQNAKTVLEVCFGLQVKVETDCTAAGIIKSITEFSQSDGHGTLAALAIFSHGYEGKISGSDSNSECSVQEILDSMHGGKIGSIPKLLFLSFCRGKLPPQFNRADGNFESSTQFPWPENKVGMSLQPIRQCLPPDQKKREWSKIFPSLQVPADCYICFSTLPDSKSKPGLLFQTLANHLSEISRRGSEFAANTNKERIVNTGVKDTNSDAHPVGDSFKLDTAIPSTNSTCQPVSRVQLVSLLTDVAGIITERSRSTQYTNIYYTLNRESREILIDILPAPNNLLSQCKY